MDERKSEKRVACVCVSGCASRIIRNFSVCVGLFLRVRVRCCMYEYLRKREDLKREESE